MKNAERFLVDHDEEEPGSTSSRVHILCFFFNETRERLTQRVFTPAELVPRRETRPLL